MSRLETTQQVASIAASATCAALFMAATYSIVKGSRDEKPSAADTIRSIEASDSIRHLEPVIQVGIYNDALRAAGHSRRVTLEELTAKLSLKPRSANMVEGLGLGDLEARLQAAEKKHAAAKAESAGEYVSKDDLAKMRTEIVSGSFKAAEALVSSSNARLDRIEEMLAELTEA